MEGKPLITVVSATSKQGRSVAESLLQSGRYRVRALTRQRNGPAATDLAAKGAEIFVVSGKVNNAEELVDAFRGSYGAFLMTPPMAPETGEAEVGRQLADAAARAGVEHVIFSGLENVSARSHGTKYAPHFTDKARIEEHIRALPVVSSFIYLAYFYTNFVEYYPPRVEGDTTVFPIYLPRDYRAPFVDPSTATGPAVLEILAHRDQYAGQVLPVIGELLTPREMVETFARVTGKKAVYAPAFTREDFVHQFPQFAGDEAFLRECEGMVQYTVEYGYYRDDRDLGWSRRIDPDALTWEQFLRRSPTYAALSSAG